MAVFHLMRYIALLLLVAVPCSGFVTTTVVTAPGVPHGSDFGGGIVADTRSSLFGSSRPREETSTMHPKRRLMFRAIQRWRATAARAKLLSLAQWCRKKYLSAIMALAIALSCLFGPLLALPANANASSEVASNGGVLVTKIRETSAIEVGSPSLETVEEEQCEMIENGEATVVKEDQSSDMTEDIETSTPNKTATLSGGSNTACEMKDATKAVEQQVEPKTKTRQSTTKTSRVVAAATATGGGAYLVAKTRISKDGNDDDGDDDEVGVDKERIEATWKVTPTTQTTQSLPLRDPVHLKAREEQPKSPAEEASLAARYAKISDIGERAFQILVDLGMIELHQ